MWLSETGVKEPSVWNKEFKAAIRRKEVLAASDEEAKERCMEAYRKEKRKFKSCIYIRAKRN